jgi:hypothetical protein
MMMMIDVENQLWVLSCMNINNARW